MSGKAIAGSIIGSILGSVAIMTLLFIFVMPMFYPGLSSGTAILQTRYVEFNSPAYIFDDALSYTKMDDTELNITIQQNSQLDVTFSANLLMSLGTTFTIRSSYNVSLVVEGISNRTIMLLYFDSQPATGFHRELTYNINIQLVTPRLQAGTYTIAVYWMSEFDAAGTNSLSAAHSPTFNYSRSFYVHELLIS